MHILVGCLGTLIQFVIDSQKIIVQGTDSFLKPGKCVCTPVSANFGSRFTALFLAGPEMCNLGVSLQKTDESALLNSVLT